MTLSEEEKMQQLVEENLGLAHKRARKYFNFSGRQSAAPEDLVQAGVIGLIQAAKKYKPSKNRTFATYAMFWIDWAIRETLRIGEGIIFPINLHRNIHTALAMSRKIGEKTISKLLPHNNMLQTYSNCRVGSLNSGIFSNYKTQYVTSGKATFEPEETILSQDKTTAIAKLLKSLPFRHRFIMYRYYGLDGKKPERERRLAKYLGITYQRVNQLRHQALDILKKRVPNSLRKGFNAKR